MFSSEKEVLPRGSEATIGGLSAFGLDCAASL
jgi:hypothetical protein